MTEDESDHVSRREMSDRLSSLRWEMRALIVAAVIANGVIGHLGAGSLNAALGALTGALAVIGAKIALLR